MPSFVGEGKMDPPAITPDAPVLTRRGRAVARQLATTVIGDNRKSWDDLKEHIAVGHDVGFGGYVQTAFIGPACRVVDKLSDDERAVLEAEIGRPLSKCALHLLCNAICGEIFARARRTATRMNP